MKKVILTFALFGVLFFYGNNASAKGVIIYSNGEKIEVAKKLPKDVIINNEHVNLGVMYEQFAIFWIPMWNYGEVKHVLINDKENTYYDLDEEGVKALKDEFNVEVPKKASIGFWNKIGGKIVWLIIIIAAGAGYLMTRKDKDDED